MGQEGTNVVAGVELDDVLRLALLHQEPEGCVGQGWRDQEGGGEGRRRLR